MRRQSQVPAIIADYFGCGRYPDISDHPLIGQMFVPGAGWKRYPYRKRVSLSEVRNLKRAGVTALALDWHGRRADFTVAEITQRASRDGRTPLLGGSLI